MCPFDYEYIYKCKHTWFWLMNFMKTKFVGMSGEFSMECSPRKDQNLGLWVILLQNHVSFIFLIV
jgi:hypothetical protein